MAIFRMFLFALIWLLLFKDVTSIPGFPRCEQVVTYEDIEALNASCNNLDNCKYNRVVDTLDLYNCNCGRICLEFNTCCADSKHRLKGLGSFHRQIKCNEAYGASYSVFMADACKENWYKDPSVEKLCRSNAEELNDPFLAIPVTSQKTGITYKNYFCSVCNDDDEDKAVFWSLKLRSRSKDVLNSSIPKLLFNTTLDSWVIANGTQNGSHPIVSFSVVVPERLIGLVYPCQPEVISECAWNWIDSSTAQKCDSYMAITRFRTYDGFVLYRNPHCALCNFEELDGMLCRGEETILSKAPGITSNTFFVGLFSLHDKENACEDKMVYDSLAKKCRKVYKG